MDPIECFAWAILRFEGFRSGSMSWRNRNPGNLRSSSLAYKVREGYAVFESFERGWAALIRDLRAKFAGAPYTSTGLGPNSTLLEFFEKYAPGSDGNKPRGYAQFVADALTESLEREVTLKTTLREIQQGTAG